MSETKEEILRATYHALCNHGFADLTMQAIADEAGVSKSLLHYHYDTKQDLITSFLGTFTERFEEDLDSLDADDPAERLDLIVDRLLFGQDDSDQTDFGRAFLELRAQAPHEPAYRDQLAANEEFLRGVLADTIEDGIEQGVFHDVDPERTARLIRATVDGARSQHVTLGDDTREIVRDALDDHVISDLRVD
ncbi:TetR/AcrR family transcriptional regulator [Salarchaeum sp. III]|uniref:TetR/AcrR family transcriptional regulator n=1 Tax=Salarchaeum sp. III TaxID=3107927 RepID=UPI002ED96673